MSLTTTPVTTPVMTPEFKSMIEQAAAGQSVTPREISRFSPVDIRLGIQWLMAEGRNDLAQALADAGIAMYPLSQDILAMAGLLAVTRADWPLAIEMLQDLRDLQGVQTQPMTYRMLARALFCNLDPAEAVQVVEQGLTAWPGNAELLQEREAMTSQGMAVSVSNYRN